MDNRRVAILGVGTIGEALLRGLLSGGWREPSEIVVTVRGEERAAELAERYGVEATTSNAEAVRGAALVVIAVKPQDFDELLGEIGSLLSPETTLLSVAAAIPTASIERGLAEGVPVVRAMPEAGILLGLSREVSTQLVVQTMLGTAHLLRDEHIHQVELREQVTSPGGTTIQAIKELESAGVRAAFLNAIQAAVDRSRELAGGES